MTVDDGIKKLAAELDKDTANRTVRVPTTLVGSQDSFFLKAIKRKADKLNIPCEIAENAELDVYPVIVDTETANIKTSPFFSACWDIDSLYDESLYSMSSVSEACFRLIADLMVIGGLTVTIVGRGHAVKGLAKELVRQNATVTVAHSHTVDLRHACRNQDIVIYATPELNQGIPYDTKALVIDLGNCIKNTDLFDCEYTNRIGSLTTSVLLNRIALKWDGKDYEDD
jgi:hypothetical protein